MDKSNVTTLIPKDQKENKNTLSDSFIPKRNSI